MSVESMKDQEPDNVVMLDRDYVQSLERGLAIIQAFGPGRPTLTLAEAAARTGLTRAAARRFLLTLAKLGYVGTDKKIFWLRSRVLELGYCYLSSQPWWQVAQPILEDAARRTQETCNIAVLSDQEIVYVARVVAQRIISTNLSVGSRLPAHATALGRVLLAALEEDQLRDLIKEINLTKLTPHSIDSKRKLQKTIRQARDDGCAIVDQELELGLLALAVPIEAPGGGVLAALGVSVPAGRVSRDDLLKRVLPILKQNSARITQGISESKQVHLRA
jgi:IclR family transcriptional regulator, pca regulon regulatory protein